MGLRLLLQVVLVYAIFLSYKFVRFLAKGQVDEAFQNSELLWAWQVWLGIANEARLQSAALASTGAILLMNYYYVMMHFSTAGLFLAWIYVFRREAYPHLRRLFVVSILLALVVHVLFPLAPPRMHPEWGFVDTMAAFGPTSYGDQAFASTANQYAAMPSVHFIWALLVAYGIVRFGNGRARWMVLAHPSMTLAGIVLTANHYWLDAVGAALVLGATFAIEPTLAQFRWRFGVPFATRIRAVPVLDEARVPTGAPIATSPIESK